MLKMSKEYSQEYAELFGGSDFKKEFAQEEYGTLESADCIRIRQALSWTERCNGKMFA